MKRKRGKTKQLKDNHVNSNPYLAKTRGIDTSKMCEELAALIKQQRNDMLTEHAIDNYQYRFTEIQVSDTQFHGYTNEDSIGSYSADHEIEEIRLEIIDEIKSIIARMDDNSRKRLALYLEGLTQTEIGKRLNITQGAISQSLVSIFNSLRLLATQNPRIIKLLEQLDLARGQRNGYTLQGLEELRTFKKREMNRSIRHKQCSWYLRKKQVIDEFERNYLSELVQRNHNIGAIAEESGLSTQTVYVLLRKHNISL